MSEKVSDAEVLQALTAASSYFGVLHEQLTDAFPALRDSLAIPGAFAGYGIATLVAAGMSNAQIVERMLEIAVEVRQKLRDRFLQGPVDATALS